MRQGIFATTIGVAIMATAIAAGAGQSSTIGNKVKQLPPPTTEPSGIASPMASPSASPMAPRK
jgi:hypothetical protein